MSEASPISKSLSRAKYIGAQGLRSLWYGGHYTYVRRSAGGFTRPGEPPFRPEHGTPDMKAMRRAYLKAFETDLANRKHSYEYHSLILMLKGENHGY